MRVAARLQSGFSTVTTRVIALKSTKFSLSLAQLHRRQTDQSNAWFSPGRPTGLVPVCRKQVAVSHLKPSAELHTIFSLTTERYEPEIAEAPLMLLYWIRSGSSEVPNTSCAVDQPDACCLPVHTTE